MAEKDHIEQQALSIWQRLYWQYRSGFVLKIVLTFTMIILVIEAVCRIFSLSYLYGFPVFLIVCGIYLWQGKRFYHMHSHSLSDYLNHRYRWLEFSTGLIPALPEHTLQQLQRQRIMHKLVEKSKEVKAWPDLSIVLVAFTAVALLYMASHFINFTHATSNPPEGVATAAIPLLPETLAATLPQITAMQIEVNPPAYTKQVSFFAKDMAVEVPEGSVIKWKCQLSAAAGMLQVILNGKDTVEVKGLPEATYNWQVKLQNSLFYQIRYGKGESWYTSPVYTLIAIDDTPPQITVQSPAPYTFVLFGQQPQVQVSVKVADDYGIQGAQMVATVSRGSGESVKFREEKLPFTQPIAGRKEVTLSKLIDFNSLNMEPGDELYFYTEAWDRALPPQKTRSDTYFVQWEDTTSQKLSVMAGLSLDNMPAYFRSQRQIIIDTEKLIKERNTLSEEDFKKRSNNLGVDQKILRLRYGQFLGEEFEANTGGGPQDKENHEHEEGEEDDHEEEEKATHLEDAHNHEESRSPTVFGETGDMLNGYAHRHDAEEAATLFDDALKTQLKAALAQMWESELRLRTLRPKEALPFEYKALELIKSIQQKSRVYVERVGFEPPPLKPAEKRLTGELNEVLNPSRNLDTQSEKRLYPAIRRAIPVLEKMKQGRSIPLSPADSRTLQEAGTELGNLILEQPGIPVRILNTIHEIIAGKNPDLETIARLQERLIRLLPKENTKPGPGQKQAEPELDIFVKELNKK